MPLYEYQCKQCGHHFEKIQSFSAPDEKECSVCKGELERLISAPSFQFKGSGWYVNDYAAKGGSGAGKPEDKSGSKGDSKAESKTESKPEGSSGSGESSNSTPAPAAPSSTASSSPSSGSSKE